MSGLPARAATSRWYRVLVRLFPHADRGNRAVEMLDALELNRGANAGRESLALVWAAMVAWRRELRTRRALRQAAWAGAMIWLGFLVAIGPVTRLRSNLYQGQPIPGLVTSPVSYVVAVVGLLTALLVLCVRARVAARLVAGAVFVVGLVAAAMSNRVGGFDASQSLLYEVRWLGLAFGVALALKPTRSWRWPAPAALVPPALFASLPLGLLDVYGGHNYGTTWRYQLLDSMPGSSVWLDLGIAVAVIAVLVTPFFVPAVAALLIVPTANVVVVQPGRNDLAGTLTMLVVVTMYMTLVAMWNYRRPLFSVFSDGPDGRGKRLHLSVEWPRTPHDATHETGSADSQR